MKLEQTENLKLQYVNNNQTTTTQIKNIHTSDTDLSEKITENLNIYEKNQNFKGKPSFKKWCNYCRRYGHRKFVLVDLHKLNAVVLVVLLNADKNNKTIKINHKSTKNQMNHSINTRRKIKIYQTKKFIVTTALENHYQIPHTTQEINHLIILTTEVDHQIKEIHEAPHKIDTVDHTVEITIIEVFIHIQTQTDRIIGLIPVPIHILGIDTTQMINPETRHTIDIEIIPAVGTEVIQIIEISNIIINHEIIQTTNPIITIIKIDNSQNRILNYNNRQRNYSQSRHRNNTRYPDSQIKDRSSTPKHQRQIKKVQTTDETNSDPPGIENTETTELQLNHINFESTDSDSDIENTLLVNMKEVENDYESVTYEQSFHSQIYENHLELLLNYHTRLKINNIPIEQIVNEVTTSQQPEKEQTPCSSTNHIYQNTPKEPIKENIWTISFLLESPKCKDFQPPGLEIDF